MVIFFFLNDAAPTEIYPLPLHDALPIWAQQVSQMVDRVMALPEGSRHYLLAPVVRGRKGEYRKELAEWQKLDRKSTRLNSSHANISYAVFCLKKKKHSSNNDRVTIFEVI